MRMAWLMITDIRKSCCDSGFDLITAILLSRVGDDASRLMSHEEDSCAGLLLLESATAEEDIPAISVLRGDQYIRMRARPDHGLKVGEEIRFESQ